jgi:hypothetical protein
MTLPNTHKVGSDLLIERKRLLELGLLMIAVGCIHAIDD